jgi:hypothetical protein
VVTGNPSGSPAITIDGFGSPAPSGEEISQLLLVQVGKLRLRRRPTFALAGRNSKVAVVDYTQVRTPSSTGASYLSYTQMPATYPFWAFATVLEFPMDPYVIKRHSCCLLSGRALA